MHASPAPLPSGFESVESLEDFMSAPSEALCRELASLQGDLIVLGVGGKMGPTLARMAKRAAPSKRIIGVARFTDPDLPGRLRAQGVEPMHCDLLDRDALARLPAAAEGVPNVVFMAGHKFGATGNPAFTWAMNTAVPWMVAERFRDCRIVAFSTACVYPFVSVDGPGAHESEPALAPPGDYTNSCVGRERMLEYGSQRWGTPGRLVRLSYAIDMRYGVLRDVAEAVLHGRPVDLATGWVNVIWQGDANEQALRLLARCTAPTSPLNVSGNSHTSIRALAEAFGERLGRRPVFEGQEAATAWLVDTRAACELFGPPRIGLPTLIDWVADWIARGGESLGKPTHFEARDGRY